MIRGLTPIHILDGFRLKHLRRYEGLYFPLTLFLVFRVVTFSAALLLLPSQVVRTPQWLYWNAGSATCNKPIVTHELSMIYVNPWCRFDTAWYLKDAIEGYHADNPGIVFPPLYPVLIRALATISGQYFLSSLIISNLACVLIFLLLYNLIEIEFGQKDLAFRTIVMLAAFPTAFYLLAGYSESLYIALTLASFLAALKRRWWLAGAFAFLASLDRAQGLVLCLSLGWLAYVQFRGTGWKAIVLRLPTVIAPILGVFGYRLFVWLSQVGSIDAAYASEWHIYFRLPTDAVLTYLARLATGQSLGYENANALILLLFFILSIVVTLKLRPAYSLYVWGTLCVILLRYHDGPQFEGMFRYALSLFPCFIAAALVLRRWWKTVPIASASICWQLVLLNQFIHWAWVA